MLKHVLISLLFLVTPQIALAADPVVENATAVKRGDSWSFSVTLSHPDTGWDHYADGWRVLDMEGNELGLRVLAHPHVNEQPFTRSLGGVQVPEGVRKVQIQARCSVDGWAQNTTVIDLP
ncbi:hypothetical protein [Tritonibacter sp. AK171]|uniref:hypothetical protein n=1 Tax=Tritonibacter sp. AK171 TaxID=3048493 RepID=UPI0024C30CF0|nr:hypothetical protein [Tritonibacter sp. AK171]